MSNTSNALAGLIAETEPAIDEAEKSPRPNASAPSTPDPQPARQGHGECQLRSRAAQNHAAAIARTSSASRGARTIRRIGRNFDALISKHTAAAAKLREIYTEFVAKVVEALTEAKTVNAQVHRISNIKPWHLPQANGDGRCLPTVECAACGMPGIDADFSLMKMKLPAFDQPNT
jgi:hypothetical protein